MLMGSSETVVANDVISMWMCNMHGWKFRNTEHFSWGPGTGQRPGFDGAFTSLFWKHSKVFSDG